MASETSTGNEMAFRQLRLTLRHIAEEFSSWSNLPTGTPNAIRMRKRIADHVNMAVEFYISDATAFLVDGRSLSFIHIEKSLTSAVKEMNLPARLPLADCGDIIRWIEDDFSMALDYGSFVDPSRVPREVLQHAEKIRESVHDLRYTFNKEMQQEALDSEFSVIRDEMRKVTQGGQDLQSSIKQVRDLTQKVDDLRAESAEKSAQLENFRIVAEQAAQRAEQAAQNYSSVQAQQEILNEEDSKSALISHFDTFHKSHNAKSTKFFVIGILVLSAVAIFAVIYSFLLSDEMVSWPALAWKLAVVAGGSAIGSYLLRQSNYHRSLSVWSSTVSVQLQTFTPYIQLIGEESARDQLRMEFARRVFGNEPGSSEKNSEPANNTTAIAELSTLVSNVSKLQSGASLKSSS